MVLQVNVQYYLDMHVVVGLPARAPLHLGEHTMLPDLNCESSNHYIMVGTQNLSRTLILQIAMAIYMLYY